MIVNDMSKYDADHLKRDVRPVVWEPYLARYRRGEWRAPVFRDMILADVRTFEREVTMLDIGCGKGFDGDVALQKSLSAASARYIGVEPDTTVSPGEHVHELHRCRFEETPLEPGTVDIVLAAMVLEHVCCPQVFWEKLWQVLRDGGVFWGFTMDRRHFFCAVSRWCETLGIKDFYLQLIRGRRGIERYDNYPTYYRANTPRRIAGDVKRFRRCDCINFSRLGQMDYYVPRWLRPLTHLTDRAMMAVRAPGPLLAVRLQK